MRSGNRIARLVVTVLLMVPVSFDFGCQKMFNVMFRGNENGGQVRVDGPDFRLNAEGGPNGGRFDLDSPVASIHATGRPSYNSYAPRRPYPPPYYGPKAPDAGALPVDPSAPLAPQSSGDTLATAPAAPDSSDPQLLDRFAAQQGQKDSADPRERAKADPISLEEAASEIAMFDLINQVRRKNELGSVTSDKKLDVVARKHSEEMYSLGYFDHKSPVEENKTVGDRFRKGGVSFRRATENIAKFPYKLGSNVQVTGTGRRTAQSPSELARDMMEGYMNSPGHRANLLDPQVARVGLGTVIGSQYAYNTQNFRD
ncbi:MAG: CAP domain-containing protein [Candidatus Wallbacteria bacterium]|nr:CAP domain-containing protein [Candidatus Wallbacteria bacterium]